MSTVIQLRPRARIEPLSTRCATLVELFAQDRRGPDDVFWLKENAELLNVLECTGLPVEPQTLEPLAEFYAGAWDKMRFFPQYYRFLLSITLDLEALGMPGDQGARMVDFAVHQGLAQAELSDLQRAEARRMLLRRGVDPLRDPGLDDRLRAFAARNATFALPNKKAAYELTHIVFYLSEYGRRAPDMPPEALRSLHFAGLTAFLEQNADLLAEICIALTWAGDTPPRLWSDWLARQTAGFAALDDETAQDDYHEFLVCNWYAAVSGREPFRLALQPDAVCFERAARCAPLGEISEAMFALDTARCGDWDVMRHRMQPALSPEACDVMEAAAQSSAHFGAFFEGFARAGAGA